MTDSKRRKRRRTLLKRQARRRLWIGLAAAVALLAACAATVGALLLRPLPVAGGTIIELQPGESLGAALLRYEAAGQLGDAQRLALLAWTRLTGGAASIRAGEYALPEAVSPLGLLDTLRSGKLVLREVRFIEGWRFDQAMDALAASPYVAHTVPAHDMAAALRAMGAGESHAEGRLFPDTYRFAKGTSDAALLKQAYQAMKRHLAEAWATRATDVPYASPDEALIMASLVEKETAVDSERAQIAGVFLRRLRIGMRLQTDPTVIYGLGERYDGRIHSRDLQDDTPYNTYTRSGLPPTPICLPGEASLRAALHPAAGEALYFVARGDGTHQFSDTLDAHNAAVRRYQLKH